MMKEMNGIVRGENSTAIPPGHTLKEVIENNGMTQKEFAIRIDVSEKHLSKLLNGQVRLTVDMAEKIDCVFENSKGYWLKLEERYRNNIAKIIREKMLDLEILLNTPYTSMVSIEWIPDAKTQEERIKNLHNFFKVVNLSLLEKPIVSNVAYKKIDINAKTDIIMLAWVQKAKRMAQDMDIPKLDKRKLERKVKEIQKLICNDYNSVLADIKKVLNECGVALVVLPHLRGLKIKAMAAKEGKKAVIGIEDSFKKPKDFWLNLFHEIAHILMNHIGLENGTSEEDEYAADEWAREHIKLK